MSQSEMQTCIFCEIVAGRAESSKLFEDVSQAHAYLEDGKIRFGVQNLREWTRAELDEMAAVLAPR